MPIEEHLAPLFGGELSGAFVCGNWRVAAHVSWSWLRIVTFRELEGNLSEQPVPG
jgi:hypothetical protein